MLFVTQFKFLSVMISVTPVPDLRHADDRGREETRAEPGGVRVRGVTAVHRRRLPVPHHSLPLRKVQLAHNGNLWSTLTGKEEF